MLISSRNRWFHSIDRRIHREARKRRSIAYFGHNLQIRISFETTRAGAKHEQWAERGRRIGALLVSTPPTRDGTHKPYPNTTAAIVS